MTHDKKNKPTKLNTVTPLGSIGGVYEVDFCVLETLMSEEENKYIRENYSNDDPEGKSFPEVMSEARCLIFNRIVQKLAIEVCGKEGASRLYSEFKTSVGETDSDEAFNLRNDLDGPWEFKYP